MSAVVAIAAVILLVAGAAGVYTWNLSHTFDSQTEKITDAFPPEEVRPPVLESEARKAENILLLGSDMRGSAKGSLSKLTGQRSDTMMVVHVPVDRKNVYVMSILRDSWLEIPGHGPAKINAALSYGGVPLAVQTVEGLLQTRIDHVAIVDFAGFKGVTDALGGVKIDNPIGFTSTHLKGHYFDEGELELDGKEALAFVRERYGFSDGDFQRVRNQQRFLKAVVRKSLSAETVTNPAKISSLIGAIAPYVAVDEGLDSAYIAARGVELREVRAGDVVFFTLPTSGTGTSDDGQSIVNIDWDKLTAVQQAFQTDTLDRYQPEVQTMGGAVR